MEAKKNLKKWWRTRILGMTLEQICEKYDHDWKWQGHRNHYMDEEGRLYITDDYGVQLYSCTCCKAHETRVYGVIQKLG